VRLPWRKEDWDTIEFTKPGWEVDGNPYYSWTYRRLSHPIMWWVFGNDNNGTVPHFRGEVVSWFWWWRRNTAANAKWYGIGLAHWVEEEIPFSSYNNEHLERKYIIDAEYLRLTLVRHKSSYEGPDTNKRKKKWHPFFYIKEPIFNLAFWIGFSPKRGQWKLSFKVDD